MKWKLLITGLLLMGLLAGTSVSAIAGSSAQSISDLRATSAENSASSIALLNAEQDDLNILPVTGDKDKITIQGGFHGIWGVDPNVDEPYGRIFGLYGTVYKEDDTSFGFIRGVYTNQQGKLGGFIAGRYVDGNYRGIWHSATGDIKGVLAGKYNMSTDDVEDVVNHFVGRWITSDRQRSGYMKGTCSSVVSIKVAGIFGGKWSYKNSTGNEASNPNINGILKGHFGVITLSDGTTIECFRGGWRSEDENTSGRLIGIGIRGHFYGIWRTANGETRGYLTGRYDQQSFRGLWGTMGSEPEGILWGRYGRLPLVQDTSESLEEVQEPSFINR